MNPSLTPSEGPPITKRSTEKLVTLYVGGVHATDEPIIIRTLLGSCVSVCLFDPVRRIGGMNHFMLPDGCGPDATRFGVHAMDRLIAAVMKGGGDRRRLVAKAFGGAHVLDLGTSFGSVPHRNIAFARLFLTDEDFPVVAEDLGGHHPREVLFHPQSGRAFVRRLRDENLAKRVARREMRKGSEPPRFGDVTLFPRE